MTDTSGIIWQTPPSTVADAMEKFGDKAKAAIFAAATYWGQAMQNRARGDAPWTDRTGNARSGLFFAVDGFGKTTVGAVNVASALSDDISTEEGSEDVLIITLGHSVFYGKYLELSNGGAYAVIMSTIYGGLGQLERLLKAVFEGS
jgi:hypothetical protein